MFQFIKKCFFTALIFLSTLMGVNLLNTIPLTCISMRNQECRIRPQVVNINSESLIFSPFSIETGKCSGSCNNINNAYTKLCVPDVVKNLSVTMFNLMSRTNETRQIEWHETCKCKCRLDGRVCNN